MNILWLRTNIIILEIKKNNNFSFKCTWEVYVSRNRDKLVNYRHEIHTKIIQFRRLNVVWQHLSNNLYVD